MKILGQRFRKVLLPVVTTIAAISIPIKTGTEKQIQPKTPSVYYMPATTNCISPQDLNGLKVVADTNFVGGVSHRFDEESVQKLKARIQKPDSLLEYKAPIENSKNIYLEPFGYFFANRPGN